MSKRPKFATSAVDTDKSNGEITFVAARNVKNLNGWTYETSSLQAQNEAGDYSALTHEWSDVAIPLMLNHDSDVKQKVGNIYQARLVTSGDEELVEMQAKWFKGEEAQDTRQRVLDGELTDVSITTDWGSGYSDEDDFDTLKNAHIIEVSVVYAGAEPKAKILAKNSVDTEDDEQADDEQTAEQEIEALKAENAELKSQLEASKSEDKTEDEPSPEDEQNNESDNESEEEEEEMKQPTNGTQTAENVATKEQVVNALTELAKNGAIRGLNRSQVIEAVKNEIVIKDGAEDYVVPDAVLAEILADNRPTDLLETFRTVPAKRLTLGRETRSEADLARAGKWSKGELKAIQALRVDVQKLSTDFIYKMQELSYADMQEDFGNILYAFIRQELPQKVSEEEERAFIVGDGRDSSNDRKIDSIISLETAAEDNTNIHVVKYDGSGDSSNLAAAMNGIARIYEEGSVYLVMNKATLGQFRQAGLSTASGLPFSIQTVADALGVEGIRTREYVANGVIYAYVGNKILRLTGGLGAGETIEQYDIDYNNQKIEFIRKAGGTATGIASAVKIELPGAVSA